MLNQAIAKKKELYTEIRVNVVGLKFFVSCVCVMVTHDALLCKLVTMVTLNRLLLASCVLLNIDCFCEILFSFILDLILASKFSICLVSDNVLASISVLAFPASCVLLVADIYNNKVDGLASWPNSAILLDVAVDIELLGAIDDAAVVKVSGVCVIVSNLELVEMAGVVCSTSPSSPNVQNRIPHDKSNHVLLLELNLPLVFNLTSDAVNGDVKYFSFQVYLLTFAKFSYNNTKRGFRLFDPC